MTPRLMAGRGVRAAALALWASSSAGCVSPGSADAQRAGLLRGQVDTIVVIDAENRSFDHLFGGFPGAQGLGDVIDADGGLKPAYLPQLDRDGSMLRELPRTWKGVTLALSVVTRDLHHRFFENQMQIHGGRNDQFAAWSNAGGLTMGHYDYGDSRIMGLAKRSALADHFFQGAFGGSFLNHLYLVCARAPEYPGADAAPAKPAITVLERDAAGRYLPRLAVTAKSPASALEGAPQYFKSASIAPVNYFGDGKFYAINTMPPQTGPTIGDSLDAKGIRWAWYSGAWSAADLLSDASLRPAHSGRIW